MKKEIDWMVKKDNNGFKCNQKADIFIIPEDSTCCHGNT